MDIKSKTILSNALLGGILAVLGNLFIFFFFRLVIGTEFLLPSPTGTGMTQLPWWDIPISSFLPAVFGGLLYWLLTRFSNRPNKVFIIISAVVLMLSFVPLVIDVSIGVKIAFALMHINAAVVITYFLIKGNKIFRRSSAFSN